MDPDRASIIRARIAADLSRGEAKTLADYATAFPGEDALVARTYAELHGASTKGSASSDGDLIAHYRIIRILGRGGQGVVYLAEDVRLHRNVALKVLTGMGVGSEEAVLRFRREAELASKLDHPGICRVYDAGVADGVPYIAMQFVEGTTLADRIAAAKNANSTGLTSMALTFSGNTESGPTGATKADPQLEDPWTVAEAAAALPDRAAISDLLRIFAKTALALHAAHEAGIVHRDIKPGNIMVTKQGEPIILDFGIARAEDGDLLTLTRTGDVFGTPAYMSPEQLSGQSARVDRRSDVYALGTSLYECLTLRRPFDAPTREALFQAVLTRSTPDARRINRVIPKDAQVILETALEKDQDRRYSTAEALAYDLSAALEGRPIRARPVGPLGRLVRWAKREPAKAALLGVLLVALPTIAALVTSRVKDQPRLEAARRAQIETDRDAILSQAGYEVTEGDATRAADLYRQALGLEGDSPEAAGGLVIALFRLKDVAAATATLDRYATLLGDGAASRLLRAQVLAESGRKDDAIAMGKSAPPPRTAFEHQLIAGQELAKGEKGDRAALARALRHVNQAVLLSPLPRLPLCTLRAHIAAHLHDRDVIVDTIEALQHHWPRTADALYWCGFSLGSLGDKPSVEAAVVFLRDALTLAPDEVKILSALGGHLGNLGRIDEALTSLREVLRLRPDHADAHYNLAQVHVRRGNTKDAIAECREAVRLDPTRSAPHATLGTLHSSAGQTDAAVAEFRRALALEPNNVDAHYNLSVVLIGQGCLDEALLHLHEALRIKPDHAQAYCNIGGVLKDQELYQESLTALRRGHELGSKLPGWTFPSKAWLAEAEQLASEEAQRETAVRHHLDAGTKPEEPEMLATFARVALHLGRAATAANWYRVAFEDEPALADSIEAGHRRTAARAAAQAAAAPDQDDAARSKFRLQALTWLEEELGRLRRLLQDEGPQPRPVRIVLSPPLLAPEFAPMRDPAALEKLPEAERARWTAYWNASRAALAELEPKTTPP